MKKLITSCSALVLMVLCAATFVACGGKATIPSGTYNASEIRIGSETLSASATKAEIEDAILAQYSSLNIVQDDAFDAFVGAVWEYAKITIVIDGSKWSDDLRDDREYSVQKGGNVQIAIEDGVLATSFFRYKDSELFWISGHSLNENQIDTSTDLSIKVVYKK